MFCTLVFVPATGATQAGIPYLAEPDDPPPADAAPDAADRAVKGNTPSGANKPETTSATVDKPEPAVPVVLPNREGPAHGSTDPTRTDEDEPAKGEHTPVAIALLWEQRRVAISIGNMTEAETLLLQLLRRKEISGWPNMFAYGDALARESATELQAGKVSRALACAEAAVVLAPTRPSAHMALARARWEKGGAFVGAIESLASAYALTWTEPPMRRGRIGNLVIVLIFGMLIACAVFALALVYRHARLLIHTIHHVLPKGATRLQSGLFGVAVLLLPVFLRWGPAWVLLAWIVLLGLYYQRSERAAAIVALAVIALVPLGMPTVTAYLSYPGSRAEAVYMAARDIGAEDIAARIAAQKTPTKEELQILGLRARWSGDLETAADWLSKASAMEKSDPSLLVTLGNIHYALGDKALSLEYYKKAVTLNPDQVVAHFNMWLVHSSMAASKEAGEAYRKATAIDYARVEALQAAAKRLGPGHVVEEPVPERVVDVAVIAEPAHQRAVRQLWHLLGGSVVSRHQFVVAALAALVLMVALSWLRRFLLPSVACPRCGMAACTRCNPEMKNQKQCGQCYHAFVAKEAVDPQARVQKEIEVHRYQARTARVRRVVSLMLVGAGQMLAGRSLTGFVFLTCFVSCIWAVLLALNIVPEPVPYLSEPSLISAVGAGALGVLVYALGLWDTQRGETD